MFGLLASTGLRISEALALQRDDLTDDGLIIRKAKFGKSRLVPIHATTRQALNNYLAIRVKFKTNGDDLFVVTTGRRPHQTTAWGIFVRLARQLGYRGPPGTRGPRLHDLRHTFAVRSLEACAHDRQAVTHIEESRANTARSRNARLAAIRAFFRYLEYQAPACLDQALRLRALPIKRSDNKLIDYLTKPEVQALLAVPDPRTVGGTRDRAMLHLSYAAGLRVSELLSLRPGDFTDRSLAMIRIMGKGRRERVLPLWQETRTVIRAWLAVRPSAQAPELFLNRTGARMTRDGFAHRLAQHVAVAAEKQPSLVGKTVTPHVLRHSCAMHTLAATGDIRKVALWLGHASINSTEAYLRADPDEKLAVLAAHAPPTIRAGKFRPPSDPLLAMLGEVRSIT